MSNPKPYNWKREHDRLWAALVPRSGEADTLQGELIRIEGKLTDEAYRNGNLNWRGDHERLWRFVGQYLDDPETFDEAQRHKIHEAINEIIRDHTNPDLSEDGSCYYFIAERVVDWCMAHPGAIPHEKDPTLNL